MIRINKKQSPHLPVLCILQQQGVTQTNYSTRCYNRNNTHLESEQRNKRNCPYQGGKPFKHSVETLRPKHVVGKKDRQVQNYTNHSSGYAC